MAVFPAPFLTKLSAPRSSSKSSTSESYDYSGLDDHIKRQDAVGALRDNKFASLYSGDVAGSVVAGGKIRDLLAAVRANAPAATERAPNQIASPLVRITSRSTSSESDAGGGGVEYGHGPDGRGPDVPRPVAPPDGPPPQKPVAARPAPRNPPVDARQPGDAQRAVQDRLDQLNAGIDSDAAWDISDAPLAPDPDRRRLRQPLA